MMKMDLEMTSSRPSIEIEFATGFSRTGKQAMGVD